jgi:hypothetical protein
MSNETSAFAPRISDERLAALQFPGPARPPRPPDRGGASSSSRAFPLRAGRSHTVVWARATAGSQGSVPTWFTALEIVVMAVCAACIVPRRDRRWILALSVTALVHYCGRGRTTSRSRAVPRIVTDFVTRYREALGRSHIPKLLFPAEPGVVTPAPVVAWCKEHLPAFQVVERGRGLHLLQEDHPMSSASGWRSGCDVIAA